MIPPQRSRQIDGVLKHRPRESGTNGGSEYRQGRSRTHHKYHFHGKNRRDSLARSPYLYHRLEFASTELNGQDKNQDKNGKSRLYHSIDWAHKGQEAGRVVYVTAFDDDRWDVAKGLIDVLPEFVDFYTNNEQSKAASKLWCEEESGATGPEGSDYTA